MKSFVISLERTPQRLAQFYRNNKKHAKRIEHFRAVDGRNLDRATLISLGVLSDTTDYYPNAALGCALSHKTLWERSLLLDEPIMVIEDDAILHDCFFEKVEELCANAGQWDFILWGWNFDSILTFMLPGDFSRCISTFDQNQMREKALEFQKTPTSSALYRVSEFFGIPGYAISPAGARKLLNGCFPLRPMSIYYQALNARISNHGIDVPMVAVLRETDCKTLVALPPLVITPNDATASTIVGQP